MSVSKSQKISITRPQPGDAMVADDEEAKVEQLKRETGWLESLMKEASKPPQSQGELEKSAAFDAESEEFAFFENPKNAKEVTSNKSGKFRCQVKKYFLTYKTHIPKEQLTKFLHSLDPSKSQADEVLVAHESADLRNPYHHTHAFVRYSKPKNVTKARAFDIEVNGETIHPHIMKVVTRSNKKIYYYLSKEDPELGFLRAAAKKEPEITPMEIVRQCDGDITKVAEYVKKPGEIQGYRILCDLHERKVASQYLNYKPRGWQREVMRELKHPASLRTLSWYWEPDGRVGKSQLTRHLMAKYPEYILAIQNPGMERDVATTFVEALTTRKWNGNTVIVNLSRKYEGYTTICSTLESLKDGLMTSQKYVGASVSTPGPPHVVVFANWRPKMVDKEGVKCLSMDRWKIKRIKDASLDRSEEEVELKTPGIPMEESYSDDEQYCEVEDNKDIVRLNKEEIRLSRGDF